MKLQLEQSITVLTERLAQLSLPPAMTSPALAEGDSVASSILSTYAASLPTPWCASVERKTAAAVHTLQQLMRAIDPAAAASALAGASAALQASIDRDRSDSAVSSPRPHLHDAHHPGAAASNNVGEDSNDYSRDNFEESAASGSAESGGNNDTSNASVMESDRRLEATIESLVVKNEWSIRVRPGSSGASRPVKAISGKVLGEAVAAFEKTWKDIGSGAVNPDAALAAAATAASSNSYPTSPSTGGVGGFGFGGGYAASSSAAGGNGDLSDPFSREASRARRRNSRIEMNAAFLAAAAAVSGNDDDISPRPTLNHTTSTSGGGAGLDRTGATAGSRAGGRSAGGDRRAADARDKEKEASDLAMVRSMCVALR